MKKQGKHKKIKAKPQHRTKSKNRNKQKHPSINMSKPNLNQETIQLNSNTQSWLSQLDSLKPETIDITPTTPNKIVHYKLDINKYNGFFQIEAYVVKLKKDGSLSKVHPSAIYFKEIMPIMQTHGEDMPDWRFIQAMLKAGKPLSDYDILAPLPIAILQAVLETERCFLGIDEDNLEYDYDRDYDIMSPLSWGPELPGKMEWEFMEDGSQQLKFFCKDASFAREDFVLLNSVPYAYYNIKTGIIGPVSFGMPDKIVRNLRNTPRISMAETPVVQKILSEKLSSSVAIPKMKEIIPQDIRGVLPKPRLTLLVDRRPVRTRYYIERIPLPIVQLSCVYDGVPVKAENFAKPIVEVGHKGKLFRIIRNIEAEKKFQMSLLEQIKQQEGWQQYVDVKKLDEYFYGKLEDDLEVTATQAYESLVPPLIEQGWEVVLDPSYPYRPVQGLGDWYADIESTGIDWFDVDVGVMIQGEKFNVLPLLLKALQKMGPEGADNFLKKGAQKLKIKTEKGTLTVPEDVLQRILGTLIELYDKDPLTEDGKLRFSKWQLAMMHELTKADAATRLRWMGSTEIQSLAARLANRQAECVVAPSNLNCTLRPYQQEGLNWLQFLRTNELAGILADDMGLGKTVQALAHVLAEKEAGRLTKPVLVVAPTSLMVNWRLEAEKFTPNLKVLVLQGIQRKQSFDLIQEHDLVLTTYPLLPRDKDSLLEHAYHLLILDEAHFAKNANTIAYKVLQQIKAAHRVCLTGTPMENHLGELWALFNFLMPGFLGDARRFGMTFRNPIEKQGDQSRRQWLAKRLSPFIMRRTKEEVATELPPKTIIVKKIDLGEEQKQLYEAIRLAMNSKVQAEIESKGLKRSHIIILDALLKMRQVCCDPRLLKLKAAQDTKESAKLEVLMELLPNMIEEKRQILLFSQFTSMLALIQEAVKEKGIPYVMLTGQTQDRSTPIEQFQSGKVPLFLISLKAGGVGLNLTAADTVIHYDPWWNPAAEDQATDRAHRIGQTKPVFVYKLVTAGTIEEKIIDLQERKATLLSGLFDETKADKVKLSETDVANLFAPI